MVKSSPREGLSEDMLVSTTLGIIKGKGAARLTMRDLADALGVSPMAAYYYVDSKDDLLRLVGNHVWGSIKVPSMESGPWHERLRAVVLAERQETKPYPGLTEAVMFLDVENKKSVEDAILDLLLDAGYPAARAVPAFRTLMSWVQGFAFIESALRDPKRRRPSGWGKAQQLTYDRDQMPEMRPDDYFVFGLDALIAGLRTTLDG
jgi:AcrR family transcriptional regulator